MKILEKMNKHAMTWIEDMMHELHTDSADRAMHALRVGLQALRDRLSVDEAAQLSAQLPLIVRGMFFEGWDPTGKPLRIRHREEFLTLVREKFARDDVAAVDLVRALFRVLQRRVSQGELTDVMIGLPEDLVSLVSGHGDRA
jgi:uncharacterized protein (DUF2267 family)